MYGNNVVTPMHIAATDRAGRSIVYLDNNEGQKRVAKRDV